MDLSRAVIYCRCSTEEESQSDALRNQVLESEACIKAKDWLLVDRYVELKSGTTTKGRTEYNRLFEDLLSDKFDIIVIKSQDRLMRNVKDWYLFLDRMLNHGKSLFMYIEKKFYTTDDSLITGIKAILAEEYSRELSKKINNAHYHRQKSGGKVILTSRVFGFSKMPDGSLKVVEDEAEIVRKIYKYCAVGYGSRTIAAIFLNQGYVKRTGNILTATTVRRIIRNPLYKGTMVMNRLHYDFETKKTVKIPKEQWIYRERAVPAIVGQDLWEQANRAMTERAESFHPNGTYRKAGSTGQYGLSGKIICSQCGKPYYRTWRHSYADKESVVTEWKCSSYLKIGRRGQEERSKSKNMVKKFDEGCNNIHLDENVIFGILEKVSSKYYDFTKLDKERIVDYVIQILRKIFSDMPARHEWKKIEREEKRLEGQKDFLLTKFLDGIISDKDYQKRNDELEKGINWLKVQKDNLVEKEWKIHNLEQRIGEIKNRLENGGIERAIGNRILQDIEEIKVHEWKLEICFDSLKIMNIPDGKNGESDRINELLTGDFTIWVDYPFSPKTVRGRYLDRRKIMELIKKAPCTTAKQLAQEMDRSVYMVRNRMEELVEGGYIQFKGRGGHGVWKILRELPDKEESLRNGGL